MENSKKKEYNLAGAIFAGFFFLICIAVGAGALYSGVKDIFHATSSRNWPQTVGKVITSSIKGSKSSGSITVVFHADITYEYKVNDQMFNNSRISYGDYGSSDKSHAQGVVNRFPVGKTIIVYYKPNDPSESILEQGGMQQGVLLKLIIGSVFIMFGAIIALVPYLLRRLKKRLSAQNGFMVGSILAGF